MSRYELILFLHIAASIVWLGSGFLLSVQGFRADRARDEATLRKVFDDVAALANLVFIPSSLLVVLMGILLVLDGPWSFDQLWIVLGLVGYAATFVTGLFLLKPRGEKVKAMIERDGGLSPPALLEARRLLLHARVDSVVLFLVVADMVLKPTGEDVGTLVAMGAVLAVALAYLVSRDRSLAAAPV